MPRLIDQILSDKGRVIAAPWSIDQMSEKEVIEWNRHWKEVIGLAAPSVYEASNICEYFYKGTDQEYWKPDRDFPCMAPPDYISWFEYNRPTGIWTTRPHAKETFRVDLLPKKTGVLVAMVCADHPSHQKALLESNAGIRERGMKSMWQGEKRDLLDIDNARMLLHMRVFAQATEEHGYQFVCGPFGEAYLWLDKNFDCYEYLMCTLAIDPDKCPFKDGASSGLDNLLYPAMLTMTMLNLKNVSVNRTLPDEGKKRDRNRAKYIEQHGRPRLEYKTLEITPIQSLTKAAMQKDPHTDSAHHRVRSHVYRGYVLRSGVDGRKNIFGNPNIVGRFWVAPGKRGGKESGEVVKTYKLGEVKKGEQ